MAVRPPVSAAGCGGVILDLSAPDALIGRVARLRVVPEMDRVVDDLWAAGFALAELAEAVAAGVPVTVALTDQISTAGARLWGALDAADTLYCQLATLCGAVPAPGAAL